MFDLQTHADAGRSGANCARLADSPGLRRSRRTHGARGVRSGLPTQTELNRKILDHLLHDAFGDDAETEPEVDLVLDPDPPPERIAEVLGRYPFPRRGRGLPAT